jgi:putative membrane protein
VSLSTNETQANTNYIQAWLQVVILGGMGAYFGYNVISGNVTNYINARFVWLSAMAAMVFLLLAIFSAYRLLRREGTIHYNFSEPEPVTWAVLVTVALPLVFGTMVPSQPLGASAVQGGLTTNAVLDTNETGFTVAPENRNILDWLREFNRVDDYAAFNGQRADIIGFVYREPDFAPNEFMVARFTVSCCVADASAIGMPVYYRDAPTLETGEWVHVQGTVAAGMLGGDVLPIVQAETLEVIPVPEHPYLYP